MSGPAALDEPILVVPRVRLLPDGPPDGFLPGAVDPYLERIGRWGEFRRRGDVEDDPGLKQIIPYLITRHGDRIFLFQRSAGGREPRLHGLFSIGVGGHVARTDTDGADLLKASLARELEEELRITGGWTARAVGVLNDDQTPVGRVHFGLVYVVETETADLSVRETDRLSGHLAPAGEIWAVRDRMEGWSRLILDAADPFAL